MAFQVDDGFSTTISFAKLVPQNVFSGTSGTANYQLGGFRLFEKEVTPFGLDGGDANDITTMRNTFMRTMAPRRLKTATEMPCTIAYDPSILTDMYRLLNINQQVRVYFPDGSLWQFFAYVRVFKPNALKEGEQPTAELTIQPTNWSTVYTPTFGDWTPNPPHQGRVKVERPPLYGELSSFAGIAADNVSQNIDPNRADRGVISPSKNLSGVSFI